MGGWLPTHYKVKLQLMLRLSSTHVEVELGCDNIVILSSFPDIFHAAPYLNIEYSMDTTIVRHVITSLLEYEGRNSATLFNS